MSAPSVEHDVTGMLLNWSKGDREAPADLVAIVYEELRGIARQYFRRERSDHTLQATALVHEAYVRLVDQTQAGWKDRAHFLSVAAQVMRRVLVDHARRHRAAKRGGGQDTLALEEALAISEGKDVDLIALDDALRDLATFDQQQSRIVELRFFGGLTNEEIAQALGISPRTIKREWRLAKAWLRREVLNEKNAVAA